MTRGEFGMSHPDDSDAILRYQALIRQRPDLVSNPPGSPIEVLTEATGIAAAQAEARQWREERGLPSDDVRCGVLAADPYMTFVRDAVRFGDGRLGLYNRIIEGPCVAVLPLLDGQPVLINIFRHGLRAWSWEAPRGDVKPGEDFAAAAVRELREEIESEVLEMHDLGRFTPGGASLAIRGSLYAAKVRSIGAVERAESIAEARVVSAEEMGHMIADSRIEDGFTIALFARAKLNQLI
jgi:ADP-ribose pyrophosphatase